MAESIEMAQYTKSITSWHVTTVLAGLYMEQLDIMEKDKTYVKTIK
jgi:hypothetical protein